VWVEVVVVVAPTQSLPTPRAVVICLGLFAKNKIKLQCQSPRHNKRNCVKGGLKSWPRRGGNDVGRNVSRFMRPTGSRSLEANNKCNFDCKNI